MSKLKGLKRVNRIINEYLERFDVTASLGTEFLCYLDDKEIEYTLAIEEESDKYFIPFYQSLDADIKADVFLVSLFHEVGHIYTRFNFSDDTWNKSIDEKVELNKIIQECDENDEATIEEQTMRYFNLPEEKAATEWALNYIRTHAADVKAFWEELQPAIMRFYRKNGLI